LCDNHGIHITTFVESLLVEDEILVDDGDITVIVGSALAPLGARREAKRQESHEGKEEFSHSIQ